MRPRIQYVRRPDGARTAYVSMGSGPTLVMPPGALTHLDWYLGGSAAQEAFCQRLAEVRTTGHVRSPRLRPVRSQPYGLHF